METIIANNGEENGGSLGKCIARSSSLRSERAQQPDSRSDETQRQKRDTIDHVFSRKPKEPPDPDAIAATMLHSVHNGRRDYRQKHIHIIGSARVREATAMPHTSTSLDQQESENRNDHAERERNDTGVPASLENHDDVPIGI